jgi:AraC-like DNA-binding protein
VAYTVDKEGVAAVSIALQTKPDDVLSNDALSKEGFVLTIPEIAQRLGISESAARALLEAALGNTRGEYLELEA